MTGIKTKTCSSHVSRYSRSRGVVLILTLVVLVLLVTITYTLTSKIAVIKHRRQYMIDYQKARYACDSATKYALVNIEDMKIEYPDRQEEPDFSDIFTMNREEYENFLTQWANYKYEKALWESQQEGSDNTTESSGLTGIFSRLAESMSSMDPNSVGKDSDFQLSGLGEYGREDYFEDPNQMPVPGPYGPDWPKVTQDLDFNINDSRIIIEVEDENAKFPLTWAITSDKEVQRAARDAVDLFCQWMQMEVDDIYALQDELADLSKIKPFSMNPKSITITEQIEAQVNSANIATRASSLSRSRTSRLRTRTSRTIRKTRPPEANAADYARLMHSSVINLDSLDKLVPDTGDRLEYARKYISLWGTQRVNINTAPRHVLETAFTFGGYYAEIADEIIKMRREKPIKSIDELKEKLYGYINEIKKCEPYITTESSFFTVRVTAYSGSATARAVTGVIKVKNAVRKIAVLSEY